MPKTDALQPAVAPPSTGPIDPRGAIAGASASAQAWLGCYRTSLPVPAGRLRRSDRVQHQGEFRLVLRRGRRARGLHFVLVALRTLPASSVTLPARPGALPGCRLGLAVAKGAGNAPARARLRRLLREAFRSLRAGFHGPCDLVVLASTPWPDAHLAAVVAELQGLTLKLRLGDTQGGTSHR